MQIRSKATKVNEDLEIKNLKPFVRNREKEFKSWNAKEIFQTLGGRYVRKEERQVKIQYNHLNLGLANAE